MFDTDVEPDGLVFDPASVRIEPIRADGAFGGWRLLCVARLGSARIRTQVDIGIGDRVSPEPEWLDYPTLLDLPRPRVRAYRPESAIAEKVHAMVTLGVANSRMKDFFDVHALAAHRSFDGAVLAGAISTTFARRNTPFTSDTPIAFTPAYADAEGKRVQWAAFIRRNRLASAPQAFDAAIAAVTAFVAPVLDAAAHGTSFARSWQPGGPWDNPPPTI